VLNFPPAPPSLAAATDRSASLAIHEFQCPQYLCDGRIVYRPSPEEIGFYEFHRWAMNPRDMVTKFTADRIRSGALFKTVVFEESGIEPDYVLQGTIERLEEVDHGNDVRVVCTISAQLLDTHTKSILWHHTASHMAAPESRSVPGIVSSLSDAVRITVDELVKSLGESLTQTLPFAKSE
jgi:ABC-type uncharacterized transport system auxiliary subunit